MSVRRACLLIACFAVVALGVVQLRVAQTSCAARVLRLESQWVELRREWWSLQTRSARLRTPQRIHERVARLHVQLQPPGEEADAESQVRLASDGLSD